MRLAPVLFVLLASTAACGDDGAGLADGGAAFDANADQSPQFGDPEGTVRVAEEQWLGEQSRGTAWATIRTAPAQFHGESMAEGACRLLTYGVTQCTPACQFDEFCDSEGTCQPFPAFQSAGTITLGGLAVAAQLIDMGGGYYYLEQQAPVDLFDDGDTITASAPGDAFPSFSLTASGVAPIALVLDGNDADELRLVDGDDVTLSWGAADPDTRVRLWLPSPNNGHGLPSNFVIECEGPDTGSLVIPQVIVEAFPTNPRAEICVGHDCPLSWFMRYSADTQTTTAGDIRLEVASSTSFFLVHE